MGYTLLISAVVVQWSILLEAFAISMDGNWERFSERVPLGLLDVLDGLFAAGAVMISYGAILGKVTPIQLLFMGIFEPIFYWLNIFIGSFQLEAFDIGAPSSLLHPLSSRLPHCPSLPSSGAVALPVW